MGNGPAADPAKWSFWPRIHDDLYAADHSPRFFWRLYLPILASFVLFTYLPFVRHWTGLSPTICELALLANCLVFGSEIHFRISKAIGMTGYSSVVLTTNFLAVMTLCASPGRFVALAWSLYFVYLMIPTISASPSVYLAVIATTSPWLAGAAWDWLGTSPWKDSAVVLGIVSVLAGLSYVLLGNYNRRLRAQRLLIEQNNVKRARDEQKLAIADDLHDTLGIALAEAALWQGIGKNADGEDGRAALDRAEKRLQDAIHELRAAVATLSDREVSRTVVEALLRGRIESLCAASGVALDLQCDGASGVLEGSRAHQLVKLAEEAASNAIRHGKPRHLNVELSWQRGIRLVVNDDGQGFDPAAAREGHGLSSLRRRATMLGGVLDIHSQRGEGTTVELRVEDA